jgi:hypothetical protein
VGLRTSEADFCSEEVEDFHDHGAGILAGLVGQMLGDQNFFRKKSGAIYLFGSAVARGFPA